MKFLRHIGFVLALFSASPLFAQAPQPVNIASVLGGGSVSAVGATPLISVNSAGTVAVRVSGTNTGLVAQLQVAYDRSSSPVWTPVSVQPSGLGLGTGRLASITANGLYRASVPGAVSVRLNVTGLSTGSLNYTVAASLPSNTTDVFPGRRATYSASVSALAPFAATTDFFTLTGSATATVRLLRAECSGISTAAATATLEAVLRSTADTGTSSAVTATPHDALDPAPTATAVSYTAANPTTGTLIGRLRSGKLTTSTAASSAVGASPLVWTFGEGTGEEVTLRGVNQVFALNGAAGTFAAGTALHCNLTWTEE